MFASETPLADLEALRRENYRLRKLLRAAQTLLEEEADNRAHSGSQMSDYDLEPRELAERIGAHLQNSTAKGE